MYRLVFTMILTLTAAQAFADFLVPEAICNGKIDGEQTAVTVHVNPNKWCAGASRELGRQSVISYQTSNGDIEAATASTQEIENSGLITYVHTLEEGLTLTYEIKSAPGKGKAVLTETDESGVTTNEELKCSFSSYQMDCR